MENKSYPEMLHDIFVRFDYGDKNVVTPFEKNVILLIDKMIIDEKKRSSGKYLENKNIKVSCESCSRHDTIVGCRLKRKEQCISGDKFTKYRRGHLLPCDRCKTYSVITKIDKVNKNNTMVPAITFSCLNCRDHPIVNGRMFRGYELGGMEFSTKYVQVFRPELQMSQIETKNVEPELQTAIEEAKNVEPELQTAIEEANKMKDEIIVCSLKDKEDVISVHKTLENIFGE